MPTCHENRQLANGGNICTTPSLRRHLRNSSRCSQLKHITARHIVHRSSAPARSTPGAQEQQQKEKSQEQLQPSPRFLTFSEAQSIAAARGLLLTSQGFGPVYRILCRDGDEAGPVVSVSDGLTAATFGLMHCDSLRVFTDRLSGRDGRTARDRGGGLGLLMCGAVIAFGYERGCRKAEILAINDDEVTHRRLCNYYKRMGFQTIVEVGGRGLADIPHLLVWGGVGTRMDANLGTFLQRWSNPIRNRK